MANTHSLDLELSSSQYASRVDSASLSITGDITIKAWIKMEQLPSTGGTTSVIVTKYNYGGADREYMFGCRHTTNKLGFFYSSDGSNATELNCDTAWDAGDLGVWIHVAVAVDVSAKSAVFYKDGVSDGGNYLAGTQTSIQNGGSKFAIGCYFNNATPQAFFDGKIDEVKVSNKIRSQAEVQNGMNVEITPDGNHMGYWKFNNNYLDETANNNDLTGSGSPAFSTDVPFVGITSLIKSVIGVTYSSIKEIVGVVIASVKSVAGVE